MNVWSAELRRELYNHVNERGDKTEVQSIAEFASQKGIPLNKCQDEYAKILAEITRTSVRLGNLLNENRNKIKERINSKESRQRYEDWEKEIINLVMQANPSLNNRRIAERLHKIMPYRTVRAYENFLSKNSDDIITDESLIGDVVEVTVSRILNYGAIVVTREGLRGIIHISEITDGFVDDIHNYLSLGEKVNAKILDIDENGRAKFSIRAIGGIKPKKKEEPLEVPKEDNRIVNSIGDDLTLSVDFTISRLEEVVTVLKELKDKLAQKEHKISQLEAIKKQIDELLF